MYSRHSQSFAVSNEAEYSGYPAVAFRNETYVNVGSELKVLLLDTVHRHLEMRSD